MKAPRAEVRGAHWLKPKLVAEIAYTEMTNEGTLRHPSYLGLREDKKPEAVVLGSRDSRSREAAAPAATKVKISNRDRVIFPESNITKGAARRLLRGGRADHAALGRQPADQPGALPAGARQEMLLPEARRRQLRRHRQACRHHGEGRARGALSLHRHRRRTADLRADGHDRVPRLGRADRGCREGRPAGVRPRSRRRPRLRGGAHGRLPLPRHPASRSGSRPSRW